MLKNTVKNRDIDFLLAYRNSEKSPSKIHKYTKYIIPLICILLLFAGGFGLLKMQEFNIKKDIEKIKEDIRVFDKNKQQNKTEQKYQLLQENSSLLAAIQEEANKMNSYPQLSKEIISAVLEITSAFDLKTMNYNQKNGELNLIAETKNVSQTNIFVSALRNSGLFVDVKYSGYVENKQGITTNLDPLTGSLQTNSATATTTYVVTVACVLKEGI